MESQPVLNGAVYATKCEFRGDIDEELGARAGITYKISEE